MTSPANLMEALKEGKPCVFRNEVQGKTHLVSLYGSYNPPALVEAYCREYGIRDEWWKVKEGDVVLDVGAGYGSYLAASIALGAALVVACEPARGEYFDLGSLVMANGWFDMAILLPAMAGREFGSCTDFYQASHSKRPQGSPDCRMVLPVDDAVSRLGLERVDWIKVDVEGDELNVLIGAEATLRTLSPVVLVECHEGFVPGIEGEVAERMRGFGYAQAGRRQEEGVNDLWTLWRKG